VCPAGAPHGPVIALSEALTAIAPAGLSRCFYADNGSSAVEVAVKMSFHYWRNMGRQGKRRFITLSNSYHGETLGALAVGRTGTMFACEQAGIRPDFMCLSKGLTAGYLPLSAVLTTESVYAAFYDEYVKLNAF